MIRLVPGSLVGTLTALADQADASVLAGIAIFGIGIIVGLASVFAMDKAVRKRMASDYAEWVNAGKPERRTGERRGVLHRKD